MDNPTMTTASTPACLTLSPQCLLREAAEFKMKLMQQLEQPGDVALRAGDVQQIDTSAMQMLSAFARDLEDAGRKLSWESVSREVRRAACQLGLESVLKIPATE
jgi:anti-anti-sigma regulatory factor